MNNTVTHTRPRSAPEWFAVAGKSLFPLLGESMVYARKYRPSKNEVFISPFMKCGTTWLQQIVHTLRTRGDMSFDDISRVVPWLEQAHALGIDIHAPQPGNVRAFKSHLTWHEIPMGGKYIVSLRDPKDALVSLHRFFDGWVLEEGCVTIDEFAEYFFFSDRLPDNYWRHLLSWWEARHNENVLLLCYENMKSNLEPVIVKIADFIGVPLDDRLLEITLEHASFDFMKTHQSQFSEHLGTDLAIRAGLISDGSSETASKVNNGVIGGFRHVLPDEVIAKLDSLWQEHITSTLGFTSYQELRTAMTAENNH